MLRSANQGDIQTIAKLHTISWQHNYRGIWPDDYLDQVCPKDRLDTWTARLMTPAHNQYTVIAQEDDQGIGFGCCYLSENEQLGTLLDNIHVAINYQGRGIGTKIMRHIASYAMKETEDKGLYLWVLSANVKSLQFYHNLGGISQGDEIHKGPVGIEAAATKIAWSHCSKLIAACDR